MKIPVFFETLEPARLGKVGNVIQRCSMLRNRKPKNPKEKSIDLSTGCGSQRLPTIGWWYPFHGLFQVPPIIQPKITTTPWLFLKALIDAWIPPSYSRRRLLIPGIHVFLREKKNWKKTTRNKTLGCFPTKNVPSCWTTKKSKSHQGTRHWWAIPRFGVALWSESSPKNVSTLRSCLETWRIAGDVCSGVLVTIKIPFKTKVHV